MGVEHILQPRVESESGVRKCSMREAGAQIEKDGQLAWRRRWSWRWTATGRAGFDRPLAGHIGVCEARVACDSHVEYAVGVRVVTGHLAAGPLCDSKLSRSHRFFSRHRARRVLRWPATHRERACRGARRVVEK